MPQNESPPEPPILVDVNVAAAIASISARTVWRLVDLGQFPRPLTIGRKLKRWKRADILAWIDAKTPARK